MSNDYEKAVDTLMKDVKDLRVDMKRIVSALQRKTGDYVDSAKESLNESGAERVAQVRDAASAVEESCRQAVQSCAAKIGDRPFISMLGALGVGVILGGLLRKRQP